MHQERPRSLRKRPGSDAGKCIATGFIPWGTLFAIGLALLVGLGCDTADDRLRIINRSSDDLYVRVSRDGYTLAWCVCFAGDTCSIGMINRTWDRVFAAETCVTLNIFAYSKENNTISPLLEWRDLCRDQLDSVDWWIAYP